LLQHYVKKMVTFSYLQKKKKKHKKKKSHIFKEYIFIPLNNQLLHFNILQYYKILMI